MGAPPAPPSDNTTKDYIARLLKLIPSEVVGLYLAGRSAIESKYPMKEISEGAGTLKAPGAWVWVGWTVFCFIGVIAIRAWATSDVQQKTPVEWPAVAIAAASFLIWVYSFGDVFSVATPFWYSLIATLVVLAWTFAIPLFYREK